MRWSGWKIEGEPPNVPKWIALGVYHTSNWDFMAMLGTVFHHNLRAFWIGKHSLFKWPFGRFMRWLGGIPVRRDLNYNVVQQVIDVINERETMMLIITPEGTRKGAKYWKTGFYWIAHGAQIPISMCYINYPKKVIGFGPVLYPSGDIESDFKILYDFYESHARGKFPDQEGKPILRPPSPAETENH
jgi:1-acyl-sn-glycerol-3-phosphate acyltransferase